MNIAVVKEIKTHEYRVGMTPADVKAYVGHGHTVFLEEGAVNKSRVIISIISNYLQNTAKYQDTI